MERVKYYYDRDNKNRPIITVCLLQANGDVARGVARCSKQDNPCKKTGRKIARDRAVHAMKTKSDNCAVNNKDARVDVAVAIGIGYWRDLHKSSFNPSLTEREAKLIYGTPCPC